MEDCTCRFCKIEAEEKKLQKYYLDKRTERVRKDKRKYSEFLRNDYTPWSRPNKRKFDEMMA